MSTALLLPEPAPSLARHLADDGFDVVQRLEEAERVDLALLPSGAACRALRAEGVQLPVIVLGAPESDAIDRVRALQDGADDYLGEPFAYEELVARIRAVLRRSAPERDTVVAGPISVERITRRVTVDGQPVPLAGKERELLLALAADPHRVFTKEELLRQVWGYRSIGRTRTLDSHASRLRRKLGAVAEGPFVLNIWGVGYKLVDA